MFQLVEARNKNQTATRPARPEEVDGGVQEDLEKAEGATVGSAAAVVKP